MPRLQPALLLVLTALLWTGCQSPSSPSSPAPSDSSSPNAGNGYASVRLAPGLSTLSDDQLEMTARLIEAAQTMDAVFWEQAYGNRDSLLQALPDSQQRRAVRHNYGPWDRLRGNAPFLDGVGTRPPGGNLYPTRFTADSAARLTADTLRTPHTVVRHLPNGSLTALPYHLFFAEPLTSAAFQLRDAAALAKNEALRMYLTRRADAFLDGRYEPSERAWHALTAPPIDVLIGPMNTGEDRLLGVKESMAGLVLHRNADRSQTLDRLLAAAPARLSAAGLDTLDASRSVPTEHWGAYDALYVTGAANTGSKATVLPVSPTGPRRVLLANVIRSRATALLQPTARESLVASQQAAVTPEALFAHTALRTWGQALFPKPPPNNAAAAVRTRATATALALAPADTTGGGSGAPAHYATAVADLIHTVRVDSTSRDGRAARLLLHALQNAGALTVQGDTGLYTVAPDTMAQILPTLVRDLHAGRTERDAPVAPALQEILDRLDKTGVPRGLSFEQGPAVLRPLQASR